MKRLLFVVGLLFYCVSLWGQSPACPGTLTLQPGTSGPPNYGGLRVDCATVAIGTIPTAWTNYALDYGYAGAGTVFTDVLGRVNIRCTDGNTDSSNPGVSFANNLSGADTDQHWAIDHSKFVVGANSQGFGLIYLFDPIGQTCVPVKNAGSLYKIPSKHIAFSQTNANWIYTISVNSSPQALIQKYDVTGCTATTCVPTVTSVYDFAQGTCGGTHTWAVDGFNPTSQTLFN